MTEGLPIISVENSDLVEITVATKQGSKYVFPDMSEQSIVLALPPSGRIPSSVTFLQLFNYSTAVLSIPFRIVDEVRVGEKVLWKSPA